jgi:hypothetical protein
MVCQKKKKKGTIKGYRSAASFKHGVILIDNRNYSAILATLQITSYALGV